MATAHIASLLDRVKPLTSVTLRPGSAPKSNPDANQNSTHETRPQAAKTEQLKYRLQKTNVRNRLSKEKTGIT